jgi:hypothetical protein
MVPLKFHEKAQTKTKTQKLEAKYKKYVVEHSELVPHF